MFDPVGSRFYAAVLTTDKEFDPEYHGFVAARSRIEPLIIQQVMQSRLQAENLCALRCFEDIVNAFGSVDKLLQEEVNSEVAQADFANLTQQRIDYSCFVLRTFDGDICLLPQQGVLAGDPYSVNIFRNSCRRVVVEWEESVTDPLRFFFRARTPDGQRVDCSKCIYADDIGKLILVGRQTAQRRNTNTTAVTSPIYEYARKRIPQYKSQQQLVEMCRTQYKHYEQHLAAAMQKHSMKMSSKKTSVSAFTQWHTFNSSQQTVVTRGHAVHRVQHSQA